MEIIFYENKARHIYQKKNISCPLIQHSRSGNRFFFMKAASIVSNVIDKNLIGPYVLNCL